MNGAAATPALSVVLAGRDRWPAIRTALDALHDQAAAVGGEIVLAVGGPHVVPPAEMARYPAARRVEIPGGSVFRLRAAALALCRAPIVAITEDHARVADDWCRRVLEAHAEHPEADAIGGVVENGATKTLKDRVGFFIANGPFMRPIDVGPSRVISQQANVSYKRAALPVEDAPLGFMAHTFHQRLAGRGAVLRTDDRRLVTHVQELGLAGHASGHFHNGRSIAAFRAAEMPPWRRPLRALACVALPPVMLYRTVSTVLGKRRERATLAAGLPLMIGLLCCHAAGEFLGYVAGPGTSPEHVD